MTAGLLETLLRLARDREPGSLSTPLVATPAGELEGTDLAGETPVFTEFYMPTDHRAVDAVFGIDVTIPHGQTQGRFITHPDGRLTVSSRDDLHEVVIIAAPPWEHEHVSAFDRRGRQLRLDIIDAVPPEPSL